MFIWTIGDAVQIIIIVLMVLCGAAYGLKRGIEKAICGHDGGISETSACEAICRKCGANLGFIGTWRERHHAASSESKETK